MPNPTFDLVIFDNDGVLIDSEKLAARGNAELLTGLGYPCLLYTSDAADE